MTLAEALRWREGDHSPLDAVTPLSPDGPLTHSLTHSLYYDILHLRHDEVLELQFPSPWYRAYHML